MIYGSFFNTSPLPPPLRGVVLNEATGGHEQGTGVLLVRERIPCEQKTKPTMIDGFVENVIIRYALSRPRLFLSFHPLPPLAGPGHTTGVYERVLFRWLPSFALGGLPNPA